MMVVCGKCGFSQPEDRYCANCGVDMLNYQPQRKPLLRRLLANTALQAVIIVAAICMAFIYARHRRAEMVAEQVASIENAHDVTLVEKRAKSSNEKPATESTPAEKSQTNLVAKSEPALDEPAVQPSPPTQNLAAAASVEDRTLSAADLPNTSPSPAASAAAPAPGASPSAAPAASGAATQIPTDVRVFYAEVLRSALPTLLADARNPGNVGSVSTGVIPSAESRIDAARSAGAWLSLDTTDPQSLKNGQLEIFRGMTSEIDRSRLGLTIRAVPSTSDEAGAQIRLEITRELLAAEGAPVSEEFRFPLQDPSFVIPKGGAAYIVGGMPHRRLFQNERAALRDTRIFNIMRSENFISGVTEFVILIEAK